MNKYTYEILKKDIFENIVDDENIMLNHVVVEPGKIFPKHPTDAHVYIIIISGELTLTIGEGVGEQFTKGNVVEIDKGTESTLGNTSDDFTEAFVIKIDE